ncbi:MAG: hypothetical protein WKF83_14245 [Nocardioidaceae bacterium]
MLRDAAEVLTNAGIDLNPARRISSLRVGEQQLVEIAKALSAERPHPDHGRADLRPGRLRRCRACSTSSVTYVDAA